MRRGSDNRHRALEGVGVAACRFWTMASFAIIAGLLFIYSLVRPPQSAAPWWLFSMRLLFLLVLLLPVYKDGATMRASRANGQSWAKGIYPDIEGTAGWEARERSERARVGFDLRTRLIYRRCRYKKAGVHLFSAFSWKASVPRSSLLLCFAFAYKNRYCAPIGERSARHIGRTKRHKNKKKTRHAAFHSQRVCEDRTAWEEEGRGYESGP